MAAGSTRAACARAPAEERTAYPGNGSEGGLVFGSLVGTLPAQLQSGERCEAATKRQPLEPRRREADQGRPPWWQPAAGLCSPLPVKVVAVAA